MMRLEKLVSLVLATAIAACGGVDTNPDAAANPDGGGGTPDSPPMYDARENCTAMVCADGMVTCMPSGELVETCALGCYTDNTRCNLLDPSNGLAALLDTASVKGDVTLPSGTIVNTDDGTVSGGAGAITVDTMTVAQEGGPQLRVLIAKTFTISDIRVNGALPLAFVASGDVTIGGMIDASADTTAPGPGGNATCTAGVGGGQTGGHWARPRAGDVGAGEYYWNSAAGAGGGFGTAGGAGGTWMSTTLTYDGPAGGAAEGNAELVPLRGGCQGGGNYNSGTPAGVGGGGGGAVQVVSASQIIVNGNVTPAGVHVGGGGGSTSTSGTALGGTTEYPACGGGSGGGVLLEAPVVTFQGLYAFLLAAGGGGGSSNGCGATGFGADATLTGAVATGGQCPAESWGTPAHGGDGAGTADAAAGQLSDYQCGGGGGGGSGRIRVNTASADYTGSPGLRGVLSKAAAATR